MICKRCGARLTENVCQHCGCPVILTKHSSELDEALTAFFGGAALQPQPNTTSSQSQPYGLRIPANNASSDSSLRGSGLLQPASLDNHSESGTVHPPKKDDAHASTEPKLHLGGENKPYLVSPQPSNPSRTPQYQKRNWLIACGLSFLLGAVLSYLLFVPIARQSGYEAASRTAVPTNEGTETEMATDIPTTEPEANDVSATDGENEVTAETTPAASEENGLTALPSDADNNTSDQTDTAPTASEDNSSEASQYGTENNPSDYAETIPTPPEEIDEEEAVSPVPDHSQEP